jgi:hypothetical protein
MFVRLTAKLAEVVNGVDLSRYHEGDIVELPERDCWMLIAERWAELVPAPPTHAHTRWRPDARAVVADRKPRRHKWPVFCTTADVPMKTRIIRSNDRTFSASLNLDVTRLEHENLYEQVSQLLEVVRRLEIEIERQNRRIARLEGRGTDADA